MWIAHCLQMDIAAEGKSPQEAAQSLMGLVDCQVEDAVECGNVDSLFQPAPAELWRLFTLGTDHQASKAKRSIVRASRARRGVEHFYSLPRRG